jgi:transcriptional regulator with XRE-family HTH domain
MATQAEKQAHGRRLVTAMARKPISNQTLADLLEVDPKTIGNWRNGRTMPSPEQLVRLEKALGPYNVEGDPVEVAVRQSELHDWRQDDVLSTYKRHLHEQRREVAG